MISRGSVDLLEKMASITVTADDQQGICRYSSFLMDQAHLTNEITIAKVDFRISNRS